MRLRRLTASGVLTAADGTKHAVSASTWQVPHLPGPVSHVTTLDLATGHFAFAVVSGWPSTIRTSGCSRGEPLTLDLGDGRTRRFVGESSLTAMIPHGAEVVRATGAGWIEDEMGSLTTRDGWLTVTLFLGDGRLVHHQTSGKEARVAAWWNREEPVPPTSVDGDLFRLGEEEFRLEPLAEGQAIADEAHVGIVYSRAFCVAKRGDEEVGHAWVERVPVGWGVPDREEHLLAEAMCGDADAIAFCKTLAWVSQVADDYADGDLTGPKGIADLLTWLLFDLQANPFYREHRAELDPVLRMCLLYWEASNDWAHSKLPETQMHGFVYRECLEMAIARAADIVGGVEHARRVIRGMHDHYHVLNGETFEAWRETEHGRQRQHQ